jgi:hypothetical protein
MATPADNIEAVPWQAHIGLITIDFSALQIVPLSTSNIYYMQFVGSKMFRNEQTCMVKG